MPPVLEILARNQRSHIIAAQMTLSDLTRWLYRGNRPNWIARIANRITATVASLGFTEHYMETLEVTGRKSGKTFSLPVVIAIFKGERYLVSMLGEDVNWVRNVRAAGGRAALRAGRREEIQLDEVPAAERAPILKAYLQRAPGARPHVPINKDAPLEEFQKLAPEFPVFRIVSKRNSSTKN
jgi:deazaflavin-dependent oxidoreductase (nitroreductase family)